MGFYKERCVMAFPETLSWSFEGDPAEEFLDKLFATRETRPLVTDTGHNAAEVRARVIENGRRRKAEQDARNGKK